MRRGVERFTYTLSNQLAKDYNLKILIYVWDDPAKVDWGKWHNNIIIRKVPYLRYYQKNTAQLFYSYWIKKDKPTHVLINFLYHGEACLPKNLNYYYVLHSPASLIPHRYNYISQNLSAFHRITAIAVSDYVKRQAIPFFRYRSVETIHHGINTKAFKNRSFYKDKSKLKIVSTSALEEWKGIQDVIKAISGKALKTNYKFYIYGEGSYKNKLLETISELGLNGIVSIKEPISNIEETLHHYDIYCQMSRGEAFGLSLFEAMACGLPAIVYETPPFDKLLPSDIVKKVPSRSIEDLKLALVDYSELNERKNYGIKGRDFVFKKFGVEKMASNYFKLLSQRPE